MKSLLRFFMSLSLLILPLLLAAKTTDEAVTPANGPVITSPRRAIDKIGAVAAAYARNDAVEADKLTKRFMAQFSEKSKADKPYRAVLSAFEAKTLDENGLLVQCDQDAALMALANLVLFMRRVRANNLNDKTGLTAYLHGYQAAAKRCSDPTVKGFSAFADAAERWVREGFKASKNTPSLLGASGNFEILADVPREAFIALHETYTNRPDISGLYIEENMAAIKPYLKSITDPLKQRAELQRYSLLRNNNPRIHLSHTFARNNYTGPILFKNKTYPQGIIVRANEVELVVKRSRTVKNGTSYSWKEVKLEQFCNILDFFAQRRAAMASRDAEIATSTLLAGEEYLMMAVIYTFAGKYGEAYDAACAAEKVSPELKKEVRDCFCDSLPYPDGILPELPAAKEEEPQKNEFKKIENSGFGTRKDKGDKS